MFCLFYYCNARRARAQCRAAGTSFARPLTRRFRRPMMAQRVMLAGTARITAVKPRSDTDISPHNADTRAARRFHPRRGDGISQTPLPSFWGNIHEIRPSPKIAAALSFARPLTRRFRRTMMAQRVMLAGTARITAVKPRSDTDIPLIMRTREPPADSTPDAAAGAAKS